MKNRHPALILRDKAYAQSPQHPRLTPDGKLKVSPMPLATDLIGLRPLSLEEQIARFTRDDVTDYNLVPDEKFIDEEDFHDYLDDLPEDGYSPYELHGFRNIERAHEYGRGYLAPADPVEEDSDESAPPLPEPVAKRAQNAGKAKGSSAKVEDEAE